MEDLQSRRLEALSAHIEGLEAALSALAAGGSPAALRRSLRSLANAADDLAFPEVAARAREARAHPEGELEAASLALLDDVRELRPGESEREQHVLVVEDDPLSATTLTVHLEQGGRVLHRATTAAEAERLLAEHPIDLVLLDLVLPDRDGRDLLLQLREDLATGTVPVLVLAARAGPVTRRECLAVGASEILEKPPEPQVLRGAVERLLEDHRRHVDAREDPGTGTLSRAGLTEAYRALRSRTGKVEGPLAVGLLALEPYERVLEALGRDGGDRLLRDVAERLLDGLGPRDQLGRWTESALLGLFPGTMPTDAKAQMEGALGRLAASGALAWPARAGIDIPFAFSCGVAVAESGAELREAAFTAEQSTHRVYLEEGRLSPAPTPPEAGEKPRVLLVEGDRLTATSIHHRLVREGFDVMDFLNGEDAFRWASTGAFGLAILDVGVPGMGGFEILERLRALPRHAHVPVIMMADLGREADVAQAIELGADDYVLKPFSPVGLLARVLRLSAEAGDSLHAAAQGNDGASPANPR